MVDPQIIVGLLLMAAAAIFFYFLKKPRAIPLPESTDEVVPWYSPSLSTLKTQAHLKKIKEQRSDKVKHQQWRDFLVQHGLKFNRQPRSADLLRLHKVIKDYQKSLVWKKASVREEKAFERLEEIVYGKRPTKSTLTPAQTTDIFSLLRKLGQGSQK